MGGLSSLLKTERNKIYAEMSVTIQQGNIKKNYQLKLKVKAVCIRFSNPVPLNTVSPQFRIALWEFFFFSKTECRDFFKFNRPTDLNFNMNKKQWPVFNFDVRKSRIEGVCDATNNDLST